VRVVSVPHALCCAFASPAAACTVLHARFTMHRAPCSANLHTLQSLYVKIFRRYSGLAVSQRSCFELKSSRSECVYARRRKLPFGGFLIARRARFRTESSSISITLQRILMLFRKNKCRRIRDDKRADLMPDAV